MDGLQVKTSGVRSKGEHFAAAMLLMATVFWGGGFTWAKVAITAINAADHSRPEAPLGAVMSLVIRFVAASLVWPMLFPGSLRGWTWRCAGRCLWVGLLLAISLIVQHLGLERTSESVAAFLTSLTVLFVPVFLTLFARRPPRGVLWIGVALATAGVWLMTGAQPSGFGWGEFLGLLCAVGFSVYILAVNQAAENEDALRLTLGQFVVVAIVSIVTALVLHGGRHMLGATSTISLLQKPDVSVNLALLSALTTVAAFGLLTRFQPRLEPTRATIIYLMEPVIAAAYAALAVGDHLGRSAIGGAGLILIANLLVELLSSRGENQKSKLKTP